MQNKANPPRKERDIQDNPNLQDELPSYSVSSNVNEREAQNYLEILGHGNAGDEPLDVVADDTKTKKIKKKLFKGDKGESTADQKAKPKESISEIKRKELMAKKKISQAKIKKVNNKSLLSFDDED